METTTAPKRRTDSYYQSTYTLVSPMEWIELHFRVHSVEGRFRSVDLWVVNTRDECAPVHFHLDPADARYWGFEKDYFLVYPEQNGIEGSPNNNYCIDFCRFLWGHLQQYHWTPKTGEKQP